MSESSPAPAAFARPGFIDDKPASEKTLAVAHLHGTFGFRIVVDLRESEAA